MNDDRAAVSLKERVQVHRIIEWLKASDGWREDPECGAEELPAALAMPESPEGQRLLQAELERERQKMLPITPAAWVEGEDGPDWLGCLEGPAVADPFGELAGERVGVSQLLYRRVRPARTGAAARQEWAIT